MRGPRPWQTNRSRALRSRQTGAEEKLWMELRNRQLNGFKFVRQAAIGAYFVDFVCRERKLVVEVDGATHGLDSEIAADEARTAELLRLGYRVFRVNNAEIESNLSGARYDPQRTEQDLRLLTRLPLTLALSPLAGRGDFRSRTGTRFLPQRGCAARGPASCSRRTGCFWNASATGPCSLPTARRDRTG